MKIQYLKNIGAILVALLGWRLLSPSSAVADPPITKSADSLRPVLSLPYHDGATAPPRSVSLFFKESGVYVGKVLCSDKARNIYVYDQLSSERCHVKKFNAQGKLVELWSVNLHNLGDGVSATVLPDGKVWFNLGVGALAREKSGLPLVILQPGNGKPAVDWQQSVPESVAKFLYSSITPEVLESMPSPMKSQTRTWMITRLDSIGDKVLLDITNLGGGPTYYPPEAKITKSQKLSWQILISGDGKQLIQSKPISETQARTRTLFRSSTGALWHRESDPPNRPRDWTELWVWKEGQPKGFPIVTRAELMQPREPWHKLIGTQPERPPQVAVDDKGNFYLYWQRKATKPDQKFTVGADSWLRDPMDEDGGQRALIVLDSQRKFITSVSWTMCYYQSESWIFPVPDGSGFYRSEFGGKAMEIYWHPLPNFKAPSSIKPAPAKNGGNAGEQKPKRK